MVKSGNRGNAEIEAILAGSGALPAAGVDAAGDGSLARAGRPRAGRRRECRCGS
jgi:hypothetical protein